MDDVRAAARRIEGRVRRTPLLQVEPGGSLWVKAEQGQVTGCFKARGALNRQLACAERGELDPAVGIVVASGGNAGLANAWAAATLGVPATVFVPETAPAVKVARLRGYGAEVRLVGREYAEAAEAALAWAEQSGAVVCHAYDQPEIVAGAGTLALEVVEDLAALGEEIDTLVVAVGGGGLWAGVAAALDGRARVVAAEPATAPTLHAALAAGEPVDVAVSGIAADSLGARRLGTLAHAATAVHPPVSVLVDDDAVTAARDDLWDRLRIPAEHGAATAWAALTSGAHVPADGERVVVVVCGANTDPTTLGGPQPG